MNCITNKFNFISKIDRNNKKNKVILIGRGPSVDNLDLLQLQQQKEYDMCTISDAIKLVNYAKFQFQYHWVSMQRCVGHLHKSEYLITSAKNIRFIDNPPNPAKEFFVRVIKQQVFNELKNVYLFNDKHIKLPAVIDGRFGKNCEDDIIYNSSGSVNGCINFLFGRMDYKEICYVGFDGGISDEVGYGEGISNPRKPDKIIKTAIKYRESWNAALEMIKHYPGKIFKPLDKFLLENN